MVHCRVDRPAHEPVWDCCLKRLRQGALDLNGVPEVVAPYLDPGPMLGSWDHPFLSQNLERLSQYVRSERAKRCLVFSQQGKSQGLL